MELTVLVDNNSLIDSYFLAEPALSIFIEDNGTRVLFDAGYSDVFLVNARRKGLDLLNLDWVTLSHGHVDHTWGLDALIRHYFEAASQNKHHTRPALLAHPHVFASKSAESLPEIGMLITEEKLSRHFDLILDVKPTWLSDNLVVLGEIERIFDFEEHTSMGHRFEAGELKEDLLLDDTSLAYVSDNGLVIISGCAHAGICNTVEQARRITGVNKVHAIIGGFHLLNAPADRLNPTTDYLGALRMDSLYACHCTDLAAKIALARQCPVKEVGAGLSLTF